MLEKHQNLSLASRVWLTIIVCLLVSSLLAGCGDNTAVPAPTPIASTSTTATSTPIATSILTTTTSTQASTNTLAKVLPELANLPTTTTAIRIQNDRFVFGPSSDTRFSLERQGDSFTGTGFFSLNGGIIPGGLREITTPFVTQTITIPGEVVQAFLQSVIQIPIQEGNYQPFFNHTDDASTIGYQLDTPAGTLSFFTTSQEGDNLPWAAYFNRRLFVIKSPLVSQALTTLNPYLHQEVLDKLYHEYDDAGSITPPSRLTATAAAATNPTWAALGAVIPSVLSFSYSNEAVYKNAFAEYFLVKGAIQFEGEAIFDNGVTSKRITIPNQLVYDFLQSLPQQKEETEIDGDLAFAQLHTYLGENTLEELSTLEHSASGGVGYP